MTYPRIVQAVMCISTVALWGLNPILTRLTSDMMGPRPYMIFTSIVTCVATLAINTIASKSSWSDLNAYMFTTTHPRLMTRWALATTDAVFCLALPSFMYNSLLAGTSSIALVVTTTWYGAPILTSILSRYIFSQPLTNLQIVGITISIIGVVMTNIEDILSSTSLPTSACPPTLPAPLPPAPHPFPNQEYMIDMPLLSSPAKN